MFVLQTIQKAGQRLATGRDLRAHKNGRLEALATRSYVLLFMIIVRAEVTRSSLLSKQTSSSGYTLNL